MNTNRHISDWELDLLSAGEIDTERREVVETHLRRCPHCQDRRRQFDSSAVSFAQLPDAVAFAETVLSRASSRRRKKLFRMGTIAASILLTTVAGLWWAAGPEKGKDTSHRTTSPGVRIKGDVDLQFFVADGEVGRLGKDGEVLTQGDRIRFAVSPMQMRYVFIVSLTEDGQMTPFYPERWRESIEIPPNQALLDDSIELDNYVGIERIFALFSDTPLTPEEVRQAANKGLEGCRSESCLLQLERLPLDVRQATMWIRKE